MRGTVAAQQRGVQRVVATDQDPRALACARENLQRLGLQDRVELVAADLVAYRAPLAQVLSLPAATIQRTASPSCAHSIGM